jgi:hypothetical protein
VHTNHHAWAPRWICDIGREDNDVGGERMGSHHAPSSAASVMDPQAPHGSIRHRRGVERGSQGKMHKNLATCKGEKMHTNLIMPTSLCQTWCTQTSSVMHTKLTGRGLLIKKKHKEEAYKPQNARPARTAGQPTAPATSCWRPAHAWTASTSTLPQIREGEFDYSNIKILISMHLKNV